VLLITESLLKYFAIKPATGLIPKAFVRRILRPFVGVCMPWAQTF